MAGTGSTSGSGETPQIVKTSDVLGGDPRLDGRRIGVYHVYQAYVEGEASPKEIAASYEISEAEVHAALAYSFSHPEEMQEIEARNRERYEADASNRITPDETE